jgi:type I restriction enzyme R subunit
MSDEDALPPPATLGIEDGATVRVYHESRLVPVDLPADVAPEVIDERADELTAGLDEAERERIKRAVAVMNGLYGAPERLKKVAADLVAHWEARSTQMRKFIDGPGKASSCARPGDLRQVVRRDHDVAPRVARHS